MQIVKTKQTGTVDLKGEYIIADPSTILNEKDWSRLCALWQDGSDKIIIEIENQLAVVFSTAYGNGSYPIYERNQEIGYCDTESGEIIFIPSKIIDQSDKLVKVNLNNRFIFIKRGCIRCGAIEMNTEDE
jgi:hypothetical protein